MLQTRSLVALAGLVATASMASAYTLEYRVIERIGDTDHVIAGNRITVGVNTTHRYRLQFRVVPNGPDDVPAGFIGYNRGTIVTTGGINTRTAAPPNPNPRGRIAPFNFIPQASADGMPLTDPFTSLDQIDAVITFLQGFDWECGLDGQPEPRPERVAVGRGEWVSVYEITSVSQTVDYTITFGGTAVVGTAWRYTFCLPPDCGDPADPKDNEPSDCQIGYATEHNLAFTVPLQVDVCPGEWNGDGVLNTQDVFAFLTAFFAGNADVNRDGVTNSRDYFEFIIAFLDACR